MPKMTVMPLITEEEFWEVMEFPNVTVRKELWENLDFSNVTVRKPRLDDKKVKLDSRITVRKPLKRLDV